MAGIERLWKVQLGLESPAALGMPVPATVIWPGPGAPLHDAGERVRVREDLGQHIAPLRSYKPYLAGALEMPEQPLSFEALKYVLACGVKNVSAGVADEAGSGKVYAYDQPVASANTLCFATLEAGDNQRAKRMEYAFVEKFSLSGSVKDVWKLSASWVGRQLTAQAFTDKLTPMKPEYALFQRTKVSLEDSDGTIGTTLKAGSLLAASLEWSTGWAACYTGDGELYFYEPEYVGAEITGKLVFRHDATGQAEQDAAEAGSVRLLRLLVEGSALAEAGTWAKKSIQIDLAMTYDQTPDLGKQDGRSIVELPFAVGDSADVVPSITVVDEVTAL